MDWTSFWTMAMFWVLDLILPFWMEKKIARPLLIFFLYQYMMGITHLLRTVLRKASSGEL